jgi:hypothetical protein
VQSAQNCTGNIAAVPSSAIAINKISFAVDWGGLTGVTGEWFPQGFSGVYGASIVLEAGVNFSCKRPGDAEAFDASSRTLVANFFGNTQGGFGQPNCAAFDANLSFNFVGKYPSTGFDAVAANNSAVTLSLCRRSAHVALDSTLNIWCPNAFGDSFTAEMIIAP